jgi:hypothetical protein
MLTVRQQGIRQKIVKAKWLGESFWSAVIEDTGEEIQQLIDQEVGVECRRTVTRDEMLPVRKLLEIDREYIEAELQIVPLGPLSEPQVRDWSRRWNLVRSKTYQLRRSNVAWELSVASHPLGS